MLRNLFASPIERDTKASSGNGHQENATRLHNQNFTASIDELYNNSRSGLRGLLIFLIASATALYFKEHSLAGSVPPNIMDLLGSTPPVILINCVFGASTLSSLTIIAGRIYHHREPGKTSTHLGFRIFFYLLYFISGALGDYFNVVFISGLVVLGLQHYNVWNYYMQAIETNLDKSTTINPFNSGLSKK